MGGRLKQSPLDSQFDHKLGDLDSRSADQGLVGANLDSGERLRRSQHSFVARVLHLALDACMALACAFHQPCWLVVAMVHCSSLMTWQMVYVYVYVYVSLLY